MKIVLFDLGRTLEHNDVLIPGASELLAAVEAMRDVDGAPVVMGLVSDFTMPRTPADIPAIRQSYFAILDLLGIRDTFEPVEQQVTLSTEVGVFKPDERVFRAALDKLAPDLPFAAAMFVTENRGHVAAARALGMTAVHFQGPGQATGDVARLLDLIPLVRDFVDPSPVVAVAGRWYEGDDAVNEVSWARFGNDVLFFGEGARLREASRVAVGRAPLREHPGEVPRDNLQLVVQKGRLFQKEYPDIPVLLDRGRYLVVAMDADQISQVGRKMEPSFAIRPLSGRQTVFEVRSREADRASEAPGVRALVGDIDRASYQADMTHLVSFPTRHSTTDHYAAAADWAADRLEAMGYHVEQTTIGVGPATSRNVIADRPGSGREPRGVVLAVAHLDSVNLEGGGPSAPAPGADDNASGSAGVLEIARTLQNHPNADDLRFILFGGEEQGLFGSKQYVEELDPVDRDRIRAVVNMDMIGNLNRTPATVLIEGGSVSQAVIDSLAEAAATYTDLIVETSLDPFASDHVPFIDQGIPAVLTIEGVDQANPHDHTGTDVIDNVNFDFALEILRMTAAFVATTVGRTVPSIS